MNYYKYAILVLLLAILTFGCSKKQEEAAELEKELAGGQDTTTEVAVAPVETTPPPADVAAVPKEPKPGYEIPTGGGYTVQVAGCEDRDYAEYLVSVYTGRGYEPYITSADVGGQTFYRVRIGSYEALSEARALKAELVDRYSIAAWIDYIQ